VIIVQVCGGLGNQMFQHAVGLALSLRRQTELKWDLSWFADNNLHQGFELVRVFGAKHQEATVGDYRRVLGWRGIPTLRPHLARQQLKWLRPRSYICEPHFHYWPGILDVPHDAYLVGYWQSERYFIDVAPAVRDVFRFAMPMSAENRRLAECMQSCESVSIHIRRGDYVSDPVISRVHGACTLDYYRAAVDFIASRIASPHFFVFSDDPAWVKAHLALDHPTEFVSHNCVAESYNDMRLMSQCRHHIIANSSFSWWGAWLDDRPDKIVIAPKRWFANYEADTRDLYCPGWVLL
jgi:hypothetical protein